MQINCYYCGETVYGTDYLSGGMCYICTKKHYERVRLSQKQHEETNSKKEFEKKENEKSD